MPKRASPKPTVSRKQEHVELVLRRETGFRQKLTGLGEWEFQHCALPELDLTEIDPSTIFCSKPLRLPLCISGMTGGYPDALRINRQLAEVCEEEGIAMGIGSQRQALEERRFHRTFSIAREAAPSIPILANIGAAEVAGISDPSPFLGLVRLAGADVLVVHLNPLQELLQPEGNPRFRGVLEGLRLLARELPVPLFVKEVGAGLSASVIQRLLAAGVAGVDIAGAGGTSWAAIELMRRSRRLPDLSPFREWGIRTADALHAAAPLKGEGRSFTLIGSGGITNGLEMAKCISLGADLVASARPLLRELQKGGVSGLRRLVGSWEAQFRGAMFLTGSRTIGHLQRAPIFRMGAT
jgi:isopentenyl-diphosphate delta-isomerase